MTQNQINLAQHRENVRHNLKVEQEAVRHNKAQEDIQSETLAESSRHNIASEQLSRYSAVEQKRHNVSGEGISSSYNTTYLNELYRHNLANEALQGSSIGVERFKAAVNQQQVGVSASIAAESARHNLIQEYQNAQSLGEQQRHNERNEQISTMQNQYRFTAQMANINEDIRHNKAVEGIQTDTQSESARHNYALESIQMQNIAENTRHNTAIESETKRHNVVTEVRDFFNAISGAAGTVNKMLPIAGAALTK